LFGALDPAMTTPAHTPAFSSSPSPGAGWRSRGLAAFVVLALLVGALWLAARNAGLDRLYQPATLGMAFVAGLVTGSHCLGMCGGFVLCYSAGALARSDGGAWRAHAVYAFTKTLSYALIGALCGSVGRAVSAIGWAPGAAALGAGLFLLVLGVHLLGWPAWPARFRLARLDRLALWVRTRARQSASPAALGAANGLMLGCGPLLAMYAAAAGTGSAREGALLLAAFGLGTLPVMLLSAWLAGSVLGRFPRLFARSAGPVVLVCGLLMLQRGWALAGPTLSPASIVSATATTLAPQVIRMAAEADGWSPDHFELRRGVPVRWIIDGRAASACTARLRAPALGLEVTLKPGETVVEFTPAETGEVPWSCWMGMARGRFTVVEPAP
jgi:uncharacterized protein